MTSPTPAVDLQYEGPIAVLTVDSPPVNALSALVRDGLMAGIQEALANPATRVLIVMCGCRTFIAGADITEFGKPLRGATIYSIQSAIENARIPVIAAIHGTALGAGLEIAMCCHHRVAVPSARCGLPEVNIGLLPGAGGTQRLPRLVGVERALEMITTGSHVAARECLDMGLIDEIVPEGELRSGAVSFANRVIAERRPLRRVRDSDEKVAGSRGNAALFDSFRSANARRLRGQLAPESIIRCVEAAADQPFDVGSRIEHDLFGQLLAGPQSAALRYAFFAERETWKIPSLPRDTAVMPIKRVGIIGGGTMGGGIAMNFANIGIPVTLVERDQAALDRGMAVIRKNYDNSARRGKLTAAEVTTRMSLLEGTQSLGELGDCELVIEAVFENMALKKEILVKLDAVAKPGAILATNTSALDIDEIASVTRQPESVIGLHFFSPANVMRLLEVVRGARTAPSVIATSMSIARRIGKIATLVGVGPGFVGNRMLFFRQREANNLVLEGAMPWDVDRVLYDFGFPMGPFAMNDLAGLDVGWRRETSKGETLREQLCEMGRLGQKTGGGYYDYDQERNKTPSPLTEELVRQFVIKKGFTPRVVTDEEILERCLYPMINEGARILEEGKAQRASDIDVVWLNGYGWPRHRGGPMYYGDEIGLDKVLARMQQWHSSMGDALKPSSLLERCVAQGTRLQDL